MLKSFLLIVVLSVPVVFTATPQTEIAPSPTGSLPQGVQTGVSTIPESSADLILTKFPEPIDVPFDEAGVPILDGRDPTKEPIRGLSILERVARVKELARIKAEAAAKAAELSSSTEQEDITTNSTPQSESSSSSTTSGTSPPTGQQTITIAPGSPEVPGMPPESSSTSSTSNLPSNPPSGVSTPSSGEDDWDVEGDGEGSEPVNHNEQT